MTNNWTDSEKRSLQATLKLLEDAKLWADFRHPFTKSNLHEVLAEAWRQGFHELQQQNERERNSRPVHAQDHEAIHFDPGR